jgi:2-polyprenyl-3-methyl-5-hydroxy-6-metoxy-1,4-benzoquinol methylase
VKAIEPPRKSLVVRAFLLLAKRTGSIGEATPHLFGGTDESKPRWEYEHGDEFVASLAGYVDLNLLRGKDVLDVGCGWGGKAVFLAERFGPRTIHGFDLPGGIYDPKVPAAFAAERGVTSCTFTSGHAERIPYEDERFDVVLSEDVLEHVADPAAAVRECRRVLRPGGIMIAKFPSFRMMFAHHLDRALPWPGLHYLLPMKTWAAGLNEAREDPAWGLRFQPFDAIVSTPYCSSITANLNGMTLADFRSVLADVGMRVRALELVPFRPQSRRRRALKAIYRLLFRIERLREYLASCVLFVGEKV